MTTAAQKIELDQARNIPFNQLRLSQANVRRIKDGVSLEELAKDTGRRDLFQTDQGGWLQDIGLLDTLVAEKLNAGAEAIVTEGWKWIEVDIEFPYGRRNGLRALAGTPTDLTSAERAEFDALQAEYKELEAEYAGADEIPEEAGDRLDELQEKLADFGERPVLYAPAEIGRAGAFVSIAADGCRSAWSRSSRPSDPGAARCGG